MRKRFLFITTALMLVSLLILPGMALAAADIQDDGRGTVSLNSAGDAPEQATGTARFTLKSDGNDGVYRVNMDLNVRNLPERAGRVYQVWLRDNKENGGNDTVINEPFGAFQTDNDGDGDVETTRNFVFFAPYDEIVVTSEPRNDSDPNLNGPVLLQGNLD